MGEENNELRQLWHPALRVNLPYFTQSQTVKNLQIQPRLMGVVAWVCCNVQQFKSSQQPATPIERKEETSKQKSEECCLKKSEMYKNGKKELALSVYWQPIPIWKSCARNRMLLLLFVPGPIGAQRSRGHMVGKQSHWDCFCSLLRLLWNPSPRPQSFGAGLYFYFYPKS